MAGADVAQLIVALRLDDKGFSGKLNAAAGQLKAMDSGLSQMSRGAGQVATGVGKLADRVAIAGIGLGAFAVTTAASFEQAEAGIRKTVGGTTEEVDDLVASIKDMSRTVPLSFEELAAITAEGGALGIATENLDDFTDVVARLGVSTDLTTDQAATALGQLSNILKLSDTDLRDFGDALVALGNDGASTESQILDMSTRFGAAGSAAGLTNEQILALSSTTASMGIEAEAGGGALSRIFQNLTLDMATASDESRVLADAMDLSLGELKTAWERDAGAVFEDLLGYINELDQFEAAQFLSDLGITNTRDINAIRNLSTGVEEYGRQLGIAEGQTDELNRESDVFFNTTEGKWEILKNNVRLAADTIGSELLPIVNELADEFIAWLSDPAVQRGLKDFAEDLAGGVRGLVDDLKGADFSGLINTMKGAVDIAKTGIDLFNGLPEPVKQLALATIVGNKLTGGALTDIAKGFGNIFGGAIKIAFQKGGSPANPLWVASVNGGVGGPGGAAGRGGGLLGTAARVAVPAAIGAFAVNQAWQGVPEAVKATSRGDAPQNVIVTNAGPIARLTATEHHARGVGIWQEINAGIRDSSGTLLNLDRNMLQTVDRIQGQIEMTRQVKEAASFDAAMLQRATGRVADEVASKGAQQIQKQSEALAAVRATQGPLNTIAAKNFSPNIQVNTHVNSFVSINEWQRTVQSAQTSYSTNTGGI